MAYLFTLLAPVSVPSAFKSGNSIVIVAWIAQTFLRLVLLPIIIVGQNLQMAAVDARSQARNDSSSAQAKQVQAHLQVQDVAIQQILTQLQATVQVPPDVPTSGGSIASARHRLRPATAAKGGCAADRWTPPISEVIIGAWTSRPLGTRRPWTGA